MIATCRNHFQSAEKIATGHMGRVPLGRVGCKMIAILLRGFPREMIATGER